MSKPSLELLGALVVFVAFSTRRLSAVPVRITPCSRVVASTLRL
jgi:hypothetical protein